MSTNEGQPTGQNPEWEINREQNIAIAKRIDALLVKGPGAVDTDQIVIRNIIENFEEEQNVSSIEYLEKQGFTKEDLPDDIKYESAIEELTNGYTTRLNHVDDKYNCIFLGVGYHEAAVGNEAHDIDLGGFGEWLPKGVNFPAYLIARGTPPIRENYSSEFYSSSIYGELPFHIVGADGLLYVVRNIYWFNIYGQGIKIEEVIRAEWWLEDERQEGEQKLTRVNFVPREEHSRVMPLGQQDYAKVNRMFEQIEAGLYKSRA